MGCSNASRMAAGRLFIALLCLAPGNGHAAPDAPHNGTRNVGCLSCHAMTSTFPKLLLPLGRSPLDIDDTTANNVCWSCHNGSAAPYRATHSSLQTDSGSGNWTVECWVCHNQHLQEQNRYNASSYGKYIRRALDLAHITNGGKSGTRAVVFTGPLTFADGDNTYDGVCEVCHDATGHYQGDGSSADQKHVNISQFGQANPGLDARECTFCHSHRDGFRPSCPDCHGLPPGVASAGGPSGLVGPGARVPASGQPYGAPAATGSTTSGQHLLHATPTGYNYPCSTCHFGGMHATMSASDAKVDHQIQIGFSGRAILNMADGEDTSYIGQATLAGYAYAGTNGSSASAGGAMTCANTYCHSDGTTVATGFYVPRTPTNTSPKWNGTSPDPQGDSFDCNNCHGYPPLYAQFDPKVNSHERHNQIQNDNPMRVGFSCEICHYATTHDGVTIADRGKHLNGQYDVNPSPTYPHGSNQYTTYRANILNYTYDAGGGTCSNISCHGNWGFSSPIKWGNTSLNPIFTVMLGSGCYKATVAASTPSCYPGCLAPYTYIWDFGDGTVVTESGTSSSVTHEFGSAGSRTVTLTQIDAHNISGTGQQTFTPDPPPNVQPTLAIATSVTARTVTLTDLTVDPDYNYCGHFGDAQVRIVWGDGQETLTTIGLTDQPSNQTFNHTYAASGTKTLRYYIWDNADTWWKQLTPNPQVVVP